MAKIIVHCNGYNVEHEGNVEVALSPQGALIIQEIMPDIKGAKAEGRVEVKGIYPTGNWTRVTCE